MLNGAPGTPRADVLMSSPLFPGGSRVPDFSDWLLKLHPRVFAREPNNSDVQALQRVELLCYPEDHRCQYGCEKERRLCHSCELPICKDCQLCLQANQVVPVGLMNDNWYGYVERFIYQQPKNT